VLQFANKDARQDVRFWCFAKYAKHSHGAPRSLARQKKAARDDKARQKFSGNCGKFASKLDIQDPMTLEE